MVEYYLESSFTGHLVEFFAAVAGSYYLFKTPHVQNIIRLFVYFLWLTLFVDMVGLYTVYAYFSDYKNLEFLRDSPFERNYWLYNSFLVLSFTMYFFFFIFQLKLPKVRRILTLTVFIFQVIVILDLFYSGIFFIAYSAYSSVGGTIILVICVMAYYYEMLKSDKILNFYKNLVFYVSIGVLIWHLIVTPLLIYSKYFTLASPDFVSMHGFIIILSNIFMYGMFILGFIISSRQSKPLEILNN